MKKYLVSLFVLLVVSTSFSQEKNEDVSIVGAWKYAELAAKNQKGLGEEQLKMMNEMFAEITFDLNEDGTYVANDGRMKEEGFYQYDAKKKVLSFTPTTKLKYSDNVKQPYEVKVMSLAENKLEIKKNTLGLVLKK